MKSSFNPLYNTKNTLTCVRVGTIFGYISAGGTFHPFCLRAVPDPVIQIFCLTPSGLLDGCKVNWADFLAATAVCLRPRITLKGTVSVFLTIFKIYAPFFPFAALEVMLSDLHKPECVDSFKKNNTEREC